MRPPYFSLAQRVRFIRAYYQFWTLVKLDINERKEYLRSLNLKRLCILYEMARLKRRIGDGYHDIEWVFKAVPPREKIEKETWTTLSEKSWRLHGYDVENLEIWLWDELEFRQCSYHGHVVMFDPYQESLKERLLNCWFVKPEEKFTPEFILEHIWDEDV